jgi:hypothetical protein
MEVKAVAAQKQMEQEYVLGRIERGMIIIMEWDLLQTYVWDLYTYVCIN